MIKDYLENNYESFIKLKPKNFHFILLFTIFFGGVLIWSNNIEVYDILNTKGYIYCDNICSITSTISLDDSSRLNNIFYLNVNNNNYNILNYSISDTMYDKESKIEYKILTINLNDELNDKTIQEIKIFFNKEKLLKKIITILFS